MTGAIVVTILALTSAVIVLGALLVINRPSEGWRVWFTAAVTAWRSKELEWHDALDLDDELGDLRTLAQLSEPGSAYVDPGEYGRLRDQHARG